MTKPPAFQYYPADFDADTASWTNEEVGAYQRLLNHAWLNRGIPNDTWRLATIVRVSIEYFEGHLWPIISTKWVENGHGNLVNPRQEIERKKQEDYRLQQSKAGKRGIEAKKERGVYPFNQAEDQATLDEKNKQPLDNKTSKASSDPASENQALRLQSSSLSSTTTSKKKRDRPRGGPLKQLLDSDQEFKAAFDKARQYFPDIGEWFGKSFKQYGELAIQENRDELLLTIKAISKKKHFEGNPWGYATNTFLGIVKDRMLREQGDDKKLRSVHISDLYKDFKREADAGRKTPRDPP